MINPLHGLISLTQSRKFYMMLIVLCPSVFLCYKHCIGDIGFGAVCSALTAFWTYSHLKSDMASMSIPDPNMAKRGRL